jgi:hypothetical protein
MAWQHKTCEKLVVCTFSKIIADGRERGWQWVVMECPLCGQRKEYDLLPLSHTVVCNGLVLLEYHEMSLKEEDLLRLEPFESVHTKKAGE